jgi:hypothetical protein
LCQTIFGKVFFFESSLNLPTFPPTFLKKYLAPKKESALPQKRKWTENQVGKFKEPPQIQKEEPKTGHTSSLSCKASLYS